MSQDQKPPDDAAAKFPSAKTPDVPESQGRETIFPESTLAPEGAPPPSPFARGASRSAKPQWHDTATPGTAGPRPLLNLFPPPFGHDRAQGPATVGAPPPLIMRNRVPLKPDAAGQPHVDEPSMSDSVSDASYDESVAAAVADLEREPDQAEERSGQWSLSLMGRVILVLGLMLAGAAAAAWVFRAQVSQLLNR